MTDELHPLNNSAESLRKDLLAKTNGPPYRVLCLKVSQANEELEG